MSFITLEPGGSRPPTEQEQIDIRAALNLASQTDLDKVGRKRTEITFTDTPAALTDIDQGVIFVDATAGAIDISLPLITATLQSFVFKRTDATANVVTISPNAADTTVNLENATSLVLAAQAAKDIRSSTTHWWVLLSS
tara:strand:- start:567 stop:983 length:417 start_codon:yes stop_codon:yes gene_type:complete